MTTQEFALLSRMTTDQGMKEVTEARVSAKVFFEPLCSNAFTYALEHWERYGSAPTLLVFEAEFPGLAAKIENAEVEEPTGWLIDKLRERYVTNQLQELVIEAARNAHEDAAGSLKRLLAEGQAVLQAAGADASSLLDRLSKDGAWLDAQEFPPLEYAVEGIVPEGLGLLVAPPKKGKSWLVGNIGLAVARGGLALGAISVTQRPVLYLALEDGHKRLQNRFRRMLADEPIPEGITVITRVTPAEAMAVIAGFMERHASEKPLVILDTFGKVKRHKRPGEDSYLVDYEAGTALKALADGVPGSTLLVVHHTRKAEAEDFVDSVSGTQGIAGSVDFVAVLTRKRHEDKAILSVTGRDIVEGEYALHADDGVLWRLDGADLAAARENVAQRQAEASLGDRQMDVYLAVAAANGPITAVGVAGQLEGMDNDAAGQYLRRLHASGHIHKISRGVFSLSLVAALPPTETTEEDEDSPEKNVSEVPELSETVGSRRSEEMDDSDSDSDRNTEVSESLSTSSTPLSDTSVFLSESVSESNTPIDQAKHADSDTSGTSDTICNEVPDLHERIKGVITRRLRKVGHAGRAELRRALGSRERSAFSPVFDSLVAQQYLVRADGPGTPWRLANPG